MLNFCDFIQVHVFTTNHHLNSSYIKNPHAHFNMSAIGMQGFKKIRRNLWDEFITQNLYRKV